MKTEMKSEIAKTKEANQRLSKIITELIIKLEAMRIDKLNRNNIKCIKISQFSINASTHFSLKKRLSKDISLSPLQLDGTVLLNVLVMG